MCGFQEASWAEKWWEQCAVVKLDVSLNLLESIPAAVRNLRDCVPGFE